MFSRSGLTTLVGYIFVIYVRRIPLFDDASAFNVGVCGLRLLIWRPLNI